MDMDPGEENTMKAMTASSAKLAATCEETKQVDEDLQGTVDRVTKKLQSGLERIGVPINRTKKGTITKAEQEAKIEKNKK